MTNNHDLPDVSELLAQGPSFQFVDAILSATEESVVAQRLVRRDDPIFDQHFPGYPIYPGVYIVEMMAQTASLIPRIAAFKKSQRTTEAQPGAIGKIKAVSFFESVRPGDLLSIHAKRGVQFMGMAEFSCKVERAAIRVASGTLFLKGLD